MKRGRKPFLTGTNENLDAYCKRHGVKLWAVYDKIRKYKMSVDKAVAYCKRVPPRYTCYGESLRQYCIHNGIPYSQVLTTHYDFPLESFEDICDKKLWLKPKSTDKDFCQFHNISYTQAKSRYWYAVYNKDCNKSFREFCKDCYSL